MNERLLINSRQFHVSPRYTSSPLLSQSQSGITLEFFKSQWTTVTTRDSDPESPADAVKMN
jgi:hypothetical protein